MRWAEQQVLRVRTRRDLLADLLAGDETFSNQWHLVGEEQSFFFSLSLSLFIFLLSILIPVSLFFLQSSSLSFPISEV